MKLKLPPCKICDCLSVIFPFPADPSPGASRRTDQPPVRTAAKTRVTHFSAAKTANKDFTEFGEASNLERGVTGDLQPSISRRQFRPARRPHHLDSCLESTKGESRIDKLVLLRLRRHPSPCCPHPYAVSSLRPPSRPPFPPWPRPSRELLPRIACRTGRPAFNNVDTRHQNRLARTMVLKISPLARSPRHEGPNQKRPRGKQRRRPHNRPASLVLGISGMKVRIVMLWRCLLR
jgi:hypothetical protein